MPISTGTPASARQRVERFQQDETCPLFLISLKAGGHGLNLTAADYVFILDPWWNPAVEAQADRPGAPHRANPAGLCLPAHQPGHGGRQDCDVAAVEAHARRVDRSCGRQCHAPVDGSGFRAADQLRTYSVTSRPDAQPGLPGDAISSIVWPDQDTLRTIPFFIPEGLQYGRCRAAFFET